jgi:hypothetical protein
LSQHSTFGPKLGPTHEKRTQELPLMIPRCNHVHLGGRCVMKRWSPTHLQPVGVPCCQRSDSHPRCRNEKNLDGFGVFSSWTWGVQNFNCSRVLLREKRPKSSIMSPSDRAAGLLLLPACLRGCFSISIPGDPLVPRELIIKMHALDEGAQGAKSTWNKRISRWSDFELIRV